MSEDSISVSSDEESVEWEDGDAHMDETQHATIVALDHHSSEASSSAATQDSGDAVDNSEKMGSGESDGIVITLPSRAPTKKKFMTRQERRAAKYRRWLQRYRAEQLREKLKSVAEAHLVCLLTHHSFMDDCVAVGITLCPVQTDNLLAATLLSLIPLRIQQSISGPSTKGVDALVELSRWFSSGLLSGFVVKSKEQIPLRHSAYTIEEINELFKPPLAESLSPKMARARVCAQLLTALLDHRVGTPQQVVLLFVCLCRALGLATRYVASLRLLHFSSRTRKRTSKKPKQTKRPMARTTKTTSKKAKGAPMVGMDGSNACLRRTERKLIRKSATGEKADKSLGMASKDVTHALAEPHTKSSAKGRQPDETTPTRRRVSRRTKVSPNRSASLKNMPSDVKRERKAPNQREGLRRSKRIRRLQCTHEEDMSKDITMGNGAEEEGSKNVLKSVNAKKKSKDGKKRKKSHPPTIDSSDVHGNPCGGVASISDDGSNKHEDDGSSKHEDDGLSKHENVELPKSSTEHDGWGATTHSLCLEWAEIYWPQEERWVAVDCVNGVVDEPLQWEGWEDDVRPFIVAFEGGSVSDVTARYNGRWSAVTKHRVAYKKYWGSTLGAITHPCSLEVKERCDKDSKALASLRCAEPFPTRIGDFNNHPLYALKRHLKVREVLHPPDAPILGYIKEEAIYPRSCVKETKRSEAWLNEGLTVKEGEQPAKRVKRRKTRGREFDAGEETAPLYGRWQMEAYRPPPVEDGKVPRNSFGNLYVFNDSMIPEGCAHVNESGAGEVARRLGIDAVKAVVGWKHGGAHGSYPRYGGVIVLQGNAEMLRDATIARREALERRRIERTRKEHIQAWKRMARKLTIRKALQQRYEFTQLGASGLHPNVKMQQDQPSTSKMSDVVEDQDVVIDGDQSTPSKDALSNLLSPVEEASRRCAQGRHQYGDGVGRAEENKGDGHYVRNCVHCGFEHHYELIS